MGMMWVKCLSMMVATSRKSIKNNQEKKSTDVVSIRWPQRLSTLAGVGPLQTPNSVVEQGALKTGGLEDKALSQTVSLAPKSALDGRPILQSSTGWQVCTRRIWQVFDLIKSLPFLACMRMAATTLSPLHALGRSEWAFRTRWPHSFRRKTVVAPSPNMSKPSKT